MVQTKLALGLTALALPLALGVGVPAQEPHPVFVQEMTATPADPLADGVVRLELIDPHTLLVVIRARDIHSADEVVFLVNGHEVGRDDVELGHAEVHFRVPLAEALPVLRTDPRVAIRDADDGHLILFTRIDVID